MPAARLTALAQALGWPAGPLAAESPGSFWLPPAGSTAAAGVDWLFYFILYVSALFFVLIVGLMVVFVVLYRRRPGVAPAPSPSHNTALELLWSAVPAVIVAFIFYQGFTGYLDMRTAPRNAYEVEVVARKWSWLFRYRNGVTHQELHVPVGQPVRLVMRSEDVIHSLFAPALRVKADLVPGRYTSTWFEGTKPGEYGLYCAEYCGTQHSEMLSKVVVHVPGGFEGWLEEEADVLQRLPPAEAGEHLYARKYGCAQCHSTDGSRGNGPTFKGLLGSDRRFTNAPPLAVDENNVHEYVRESLRDPRAKIVEGFQPIMQRYDSMSDDEISALAEFIKTLK